MLCKNYQYSRSNLADLDSFKFSDSEHNSSLWFIFCSSPLIDHPSVLNFISKIPESNLVMGCSTSGEIIQNQVNEDSVVVAQLVFNKTKIKSFSVNLDNPENSFYVGKTIAEKLSAPDLKNIIILSEGLNVNGTELTNGLNSAVSSSVAISGGLAGDGSAFSKTYVIANRSFKSNYVTAVGFYGDNINISCGSTGGWDIFGPEIVITKSNNNTLYEIDNQPALDLYKKYLGEQSAKLPASALLFPMQIWSDANSNERVVRTILAVDENEKSLTFAGNMPLGYSAQLMRANFERLVDASGRLATNLNQNTAGFSLAISCVGRKLLLGERTDEEVGALLDHLPKNTTQIGFYSYGELAAAIEKGPCCLHNQTMSLTYITEKS